MKFNSKLLEIVSITTLLLGVCGIYILKAEAADLTVNNYLVVDNDIDDVNEVRNSQNNPTISAEQAREAALAANPNTTAEKVDLDEEDGQLRYKVKLNNGRKVYIDAYNGNVLGSEIDD